MSGGQNSLFNHVGSIPKCPANSKELKELYNMEDQVYNMKRRVRQKQKCFLELIKQQVSITKLRERNIEKEAK